ncbi:transporter substrate-binding domain-containing protein [Fulvimarina sp. 2208YS6-2-32]|uniref:Transporter substrate-binding domain-containing protein n=1 Tax=Fulvimarina uroteuthidis TaxID=3098149 RepID=A0ABU5I3Y8_9HYPH|nr:transporter substrate-binding domain-containing protein [Fulvimarina sp. 2208YS6-2-32]MDY8110102.1 transporter substrate-binding domain-containing protein [Fulvimarina sp. 2208YS6-2-32]
MATYTKMGEALVEDGTLKIAINLGNAALAARDAATGELGGITVALARRLCAALGCAAELIPFEGAGKVVAAAGDDVWRVGFCAIDPGREGQVVFSSPYVLIEAKALVRADSPLQSVGDLDRDGIRLMVAQGSAYDLHLSAHPGRMTLIREATPGASFDAFRNGRGDADAVAGVTQSLERAFGDDPAYRLLDGTITAIGQAMVMPKRFAALADELTRFVETAKADGYVRRELDRAGQRDLVVAPPA